MHSVKIAYGLKEGTLHFIGIVERGIACECVCPKCGGRLVARRGEERAQHFAHEDASQCEGAAEHALRDKLVELIQSTGELVLPESSQMIEGRVRVIVQQESGKVISVSGEQAGGPLAPRLRVRVEGAAGEIEEIVALVHLGRKLTNDGTPTEAAVEINLAELGEDFSPNSLRRVLFGETRCLRWLRRPRADEAAAKIHEELEIERVRTTEAERERLLERARRRPATAEWESLAERVPSFGGFILENSHASVSGGPYKYELLPYTCEECGQEGLNLRDMMIARTGSATGVCVRCSKAKWKDADRSEEEPF